MEHEKKPMGFRQYILLIAFAIVFWAGLNNLGLVYSTVKKILAMLLPLCIGGCVAFILNVPMSAMERGFARAQQRRGKPIKESRNATISLLITLLGFLLLIAFVIYIAAPQLVTSFSGLGVKIVAFYPKALNFLTANGFNTESIQKFVNNFDILSLLSRLGSSDTLGNGAQLVGGAQLVLNTLIGTASTVITSVATFFIGMVLAVYLLAMKRKLGSQCTKILYAYVKTPLADRVMQVVRIFYKTYASFISGQCMEACILGLLFYVVLSIFRFPYASTISVLAAVMQLLPYVGSFLACVIGTFLILMEDPMRALLFVVTFLVVQQVEGQLIYPRVVGKSVGLPAMWTLLAVLIGVNLFGVLGILFFIPLTSVMYQLLRSAVYSRLKKKHVAVAEHIRAVDEEIDRDMAKPEEPPEETAEAEEKKE